MRDQKGITLMEIIVDMIIIGIAVAIYVPSYFNSVLAAQSANAVSNIR